MLTSQTEELLDRLKTGSFIPEDIQALEGTSAQDFLADLDSVYCCRFQERHVSVPKFRPLLPLIHAEFASLSGMGARTFISSRSICACRAGLRILSPVRSVT